MTNLEKRHIKNTSLMLLENGAGPTSGTVCVRTIIEFTNNLYSGHHQAKEPEVGQGKHSEELYLKKKKKLTTSKTRPSGSIRY
jgi:hypothetical protein